MKKLKSVKGGESINTFSNYLKEFADEIKRQFSVLFNDYLELVYSPVKILPGIITIKPGDYYWKELSLEGKQIQSKLHNDYEQFSSIIRTLLCKQIKQIRISFEDYDKSIRSIIEQQGRTYESSKVPFLNEAIRLIDEQISLLQTIYGERAGSTIIVPDTNALIYNPSLEDWTFDNIPKFELILTSTVLEELDKLKTYKNDNVKEKAERLINRLKGYRTRGRLLDGIPLRKGISSLRTIALEPDFNNTLPWLSSDNKDDRILASFIEIIRHHLHSEVLLCTRDINLQNKADYARLPFIEPPKVP